MQLSAELAYGIRVAVRLARQPEEADVADIARRQQSSAGYVSKAVAPLIRIGIIVPTGTNRIALAKPPEDVTLADVVQAYAPPLELQRCLLRHGELHPCQAHSDCGLCRLWFRVQTDILDVLGRYTLAEFAREADTIETLRAMMEDEDDSQGN